MPTVLVVDDDLVFRTGLVTLLDRAPGILVAGEASGGEEAVRLAAACKPDVILMDIRMPHGDGITATGQIVGAEADPPPRVIVLTTFDLDRYVYEALRVGACGFLLKGTPPDRLFAAIETVASGDMLFSPSVTRRLIEAYVLSPEPTAEIPPRTGSLTPRELEVLRMVGTGLSNTEIAERLVLSTATVKTHINRTMTKLDLSSRAQAVVHAYETGLVTPKRYQPAPPRRGSGELL
ncbi:response regulator transcription factor [Streptomyces europaeiscabiei]|uniref:response regulator transcription factor n=1 Tax=Streptomyces europaeiscabiei TaxID=146819 RepID=UPI0029B3AFF8|nr:response regulator transcription factor [Streptomyces europaeiscabiei]MDX3580348.1 response regulator transcription factor [Streptomyces europaeiscabiei]